MGFVGLYNMPMGVSQIADCKRGLYIMYKAGHCYIQVQGCSCQTCRL